MKAIAKALIQSVRFLEFSDEKILNEDAAVQAMEMISCTLKSATPDEVKILQETLDEAIQQTRNCGGTIEEISFYENFLETIGLK